MKFSCIIILILVLTTLNTDLLSPLMSASLSKEQKAQSLMIAEAYEALYQNDYAQAASLSFRLIDLKKLHYKDPYFILGELHLTEKLYQSALFYYERILDGPRPWLIRENRIRFYYQLSAAYYYTQAPQKQLTTLLAIIQEGGEANGSLYQDFIGQANFMLALGYWAFEEKGKSLIYLNQMLQNKVRPLFATLLLTYYYASTSSEDITTHYEQYIKLPGSIARAPRREESFSFYDKKLSAELKTYTFSPAQYQELIRYQKLLDVIAEYRKTLLNERQNKRKDDREYIDSLSEETTLAPPVLPLNKNLRRPKLNNTPNPSFNARNLQNKKVVPATTATATGQNKKGVATPKENPPPPQKILASEVEDFEDKIQSLYQKYNQPLFFSGQSK